MPLLHRRPHLSKRPFTLIEVLIAFTLVAILITTLMDYYWQFAVFQTESDRIRQNVFQMRLVQSRLAEVLPKASSPAPKKKGPEGSTSTEAKSNDSSTPGAKPNANPPDAQGKTQPDAQAKAKPGKKAKIPDDFFFLSDRADPGMAAAPSLVFTYDNGPDIDPDFCNGVLGRLYRVDNAKGELWLATWPRPSCARDPKTNQRTSHKVRRELLLEGVANLDFRFYEPPRKGPIEISAEQAQKGPIELAKPDDWNPLWPIEYMALPAIIKVSVEMKKDAVNYPNQWLDFYFPLPNSGKTVIIAQPEPTSS